MIIFNISWKQTLNIRTSWYLISCDCNYPFTVYFHYLVHEGIRFHESKLTKAVHPYLMVRYYFLPNCCCGKKLTNMSSITFFSHHPTKKLLRLNYHKYTAYSSQVMKVLHISLIKDSSKGISQSWCFTKHIKSFYGCR